MLIGAAGDWKNWLSFLSAVGAMAWASYRLLGHHAGRFLLLRTVILVILLLGVVGIAVFGIASDRAGTATAVASGCFAAAVILGQWWRRLAIGNVDSTGGKLSDLLVTWLLLGGALVLAVYAQL
jgi:Na+(H+)/acetate symporter ActP